MTKKRGVTLTELLVVLSVCSVVMTISIALIQRAMHAERRSRTFFNLQRSSLRLADQFRADVRQASAIVDTTELPEGSLLQLRTSDDQLVDYRHDAGVILRTVSRNDATVSRETFAFHPQIEAQVSHAPSSRMVGLSITTPTRESPDEADSAESASSSAALPTPRELVIPVRLEVEACLGRDARQVNQRTSEEAAP